MKKLLRIKSDKTTTLVKYIDTRTKTEPETVTVECPDPPLDSLAKALDDMAMHLIVICELPTDWLGELEVRAVSCAWGDDPTAGIVISAIRRLESSNIPLAINSPYTKEYSDACKEALVTLSAEAFKYAAGARGQLDLGLETERKEEPA